MAKKDRKQELDTKMLSGNWHNSRILTQMCNYKPCIVYSETK